MVVSGGVVVAVVVALFSVVVSTVSSGASLLFPESPLPPQLAKRSKEASKSVRATTIEALIEGRIVHVFVQAFVVVAVFP